MITLLVFAFTSLLPFCPSAYALALNLLNITSSDSLGNIVPNVHCTNDPTWLIPAFPDIRYYDDACQRAMFKAREDLWTYGPYVEHEFLTRGATPQTTKPQIVLPRKYVVRKYNDLTRTLRSKKR